MTALKLTAVVAAILVFAVPMALGAELSRDEYVAKVEPICEANSQANERILKGVRDKVRTGKLDAAGAQFTQAAAALKQTLVQLKAVPAPAADAAKLTKWLGYVKTEADLFA